MKTFTRWNSSSFSIKHALHINTYGFSFLLMSTFATQALVASDKQAARSLYDVSQLSSQKINHNEKKSLPDQTQTKTSITPDIIAQNDEKESSSNSSSTSTAQIITEETSSGPVINFNNVSIIEFIRFVSRLTGKNFIFDPNELQFTVTIISETPASLEDVMAALLQNLRIHEFEMSEQGSGILIYKNKDVRAPAGLFKQNGEFPNSPQVATQVFLIEYVDPARVGAIVKSMVSADAIVELIQESKRLVVTDLAANIKKIGELLSALDSPKSGLEIGQYVGQNGSPAGLANMAEKLLSPVLAGQTFVLVPHPTSNSVFVISSPFLVEKALSIMQTIDLGDTSSRILSFDEMKFDAALAKKIAEAPTQKTVSHEDMGKLTEEQIKKILREQGFSDDEIEKMASSEREKYLKQIELGPEGFAIVSEVRKRRIFESPLPLGQVESTQFYIHKLQYRRAEDVTKALRAIASSILSANDKNPTQSDLIVTLDSLQVIEENNSIVLTGTSATIQKAKNLISDIDIPVRQVLIEVLALDTTLANSLNFGVDSGVKFQKRNFAIEGGFFGSQNTNLIGALSQVTGVPVPPPPPLPHSTTPFDLTPDTVVGTPSSVAGQAASFGTSPPSPGFTAGSIGRKILYNGKGFLALAALVNAVRTDNDTNIIMNPKLTTEHNVPAELFVGQQVGIKGQSISNNNGNILTTNYELRETGTLLKVTPLISANDTITLIIEQRISRVSQAAINAQSSQNAPPATINETRTISRVHLPSEHFIVLSGMITEEQDVVRTQIPCLGGLPIVGAMFSQSSNVNNKRNLLLFLRPYVIDNEVDIDDITKKQQDIFNEKSKPSSQQRGIFDDIKTILNF